MSTGGSDAAGLGLLDGGSLPDVWAARWSADQARPLLWFGRDGWVTAAELDSGTARAAGRLWRAGVRRGDRIVLSAGTSRGFVETYVGALRLGAVVVPTNPAYAERELAHIVSDSAPACAIVDDPTRAEWVRQTHPSIVVTTTSLDLPDGDPDDLDGLSPDDPALICYTSGTTGAPKGAVLSHGNCLSNARAVALAWQWTSDDRLVLALPLFHVHGLAVGLHGTLQVGASAVVLPRFDLDDVLDAVAVHEATMFFGVPTMYARLCDSPRLGELRRLRLCVSGSAALPPMLFERVEAATGHRVLERYGMSETLMNVSNPYDGERRPGTVGFPLPGVEMRLTNGTEGEIELRGPNVFDGYWRNPTATAEAFTDDGWFRTGDLGALDPDDYLRIVGRAKELIITGGYNVYPREVEEVLLSHDDVREVAVVGEPSEEWGEIVVAFVVPADGSPDEEGILALAARELAPHKRPRRLRFVDALPRNALGKVMKHQLRANDSDSLSGDP